MIECKHRWPMVVTNRGLRTWYCKFFYKFVNDTICEQCPHKEGQSPKPPMPDLPFPSRTNEEVKAIHEVCKGCPLLNHDSQICSKMDAEFHPVDIVAQHPSNHCPEQKW